MTAWLTFGIMRISDFLILLEHHNQLFLQLHGHIFVKKLNWTKQFKINYVLIPWFDSSVIDLNPSWSNKRLFNTFRQYSHQLANYQSASCLVIFKLCNCWKTRRFLLDNSTNLTVDLIPWSKPGFEELKWLILV